MALMTVRDLVCLVTSGHPDRYRKSQLQAVKAFASSVHCPTVGDAPCDHFCLPVPIVGMIP